MIRIVPWLLSPNERVIISYKDAKATSIHASKYRLISIER